MDGIKAAANLLDPENKPSYALEEADLSRWQEAFPIAHCSSDELRSWRMAYMQAVSTLENDPGILPGDEQRLYKILVWTVDCYRNAQQNYG